MAIPNDQEIYLGRDRLPTEQASLRDKLKELLDEKFKNTSQQRVVYIKSGQTVRYGTVVNVINAIRDAGYETIGLVSEKEKAGGGAASE